MKASNGSIYHRGNSWTIDFTVNGRRVREAVGSNKRIAETILHKRITEAVENRYFDKRTEGNTAFADFATQYLETVTATQKSARTERTRVRAWAQEFGNKPLGQISKREIEEWQRKKRAIRKPATVNRDLCRLRHMLNKAVEWQLLSHNPMARLRFLRENNARKRYLTLQECQRLKESCIALHIKAVVTMALHTGMRLGEILNLQKADVDFASRSLLVRDSKNGDPRHVPMDSTVVALLTAWITRSKSQYLFSNPQGGQLRDVRTGFLKALERANITDLHFHDLRHTFASHFMMAGGELYVLKEILGHKSIAMTQRYAHLSPDYRRAAMVRMESVWNADSVNQSPAVTDRTQPLPL